MDARQGRDRAGTAKARSTTAVPDRDTLLAYVKSFLRCLIGVVR